MLWCQPNNTVPHTSYCSWRIWSIVYTRSCVSVLRDTGVSDVCDEARSKEQGIHRGTNQHTNKCYLHILGRQQHTWNQELCLPGVITARKDPYQKKQIGNYCKKSFLWNSPDWSGSQSQYVNNSSVHGRGQQHDKSRKHRPQLNRGDTRRWLRGVVQCTQVVPQRESSHRSTGHVHPDAFSDTLQC